MTRRRSHLAGLLATRKAGGLTASLILVVTVAVALPGCDVSTPRGDGNADTRASARQSSGERVAAESLGPVLAWVNDEPIHEREIDFFLENRMNLLPFQTRDEAMREKVLQSLIASRAMAQVAARELSEFERGEVAMQTAFFREELLAKRYLEKNAQPEPVSREMVREYYDNNLQEFGQEVLREIEWLATAKNLDSKEREALLPLFQSLDDASDWQQLATDTNQRGERVEYKGGIFAMELLSPRLAAVVQSTPVGATSGLHMIDGRLHRISVLSVKELPAKPLAEVSVEIRKRLAPTAMRESVQKASDAVTAEVEIRYAEAADGQ